MFNPRRVQIHTLMSPCPMRNDRLCDGFRMTAHLRWCHEHRGRRPKAAKEGKRGEWGTRLSGRYGDLAGADGAAGARGGREGFGEEGQTRR
jgi:hypothetical protein